MLFDVDDLVSEHEKLVEMMKETPFPDKPPFDTETFINEVCGE